MIAIDEKFGNLRTVREGELLYKKLKEKRKARRLKNGKNNRKL